ncbi:MFS transporter [Kribbella qitaiheensis]|uniref:MFS transporter n=1 Tax=Kribbella qitaiheensis TaxID=1544730 RepID=UPI00361E4DE1
MSTSTTSPAQVDPPAPADAPAYKWRWIVLGTVLVAEIMDLVDATIVNIAAPSIRAELGGSEAALQWMLAGYTLAFAIGLISFGRLGDLVGRRRLFVIGAVGFTVASAICGLATSPEMLIGSRVAQGLLGAVMIPQGFGLFTIQGVVGA